MPLHTAAAAVPSTTDLLVKAGLGERASDGSFLRTTPPPGVESAFTVQAMADPSIPASGNSTPVQRGVTFDEVQTEVNPRSGGGSAGGGEEAPYTRKLYRQLKAELEADIRRQLEAKSRYNRYRP
jgi:hypothetical protein